MKTLKITLFAIISGLILPLLHSCGKYPDGPNFTILSRKTRIENVWVQTETVYADGTVEKNPDPGYTTEFTSDGEVFYSNGTFTLKGTWDLVNDKKDLRLSYSGVGSVDYEIRRLKAKEMWLKNNQGDVLKYEPD